MITNGVVVGGGGEWGRRPGQHSSMGGKGEEEE